MPRTAITKSQKLAQVWAAQDAELRGEIARFLAAKSLKMEELATLVHMTRATLYNRYKRPETFSLTELRWLLAVIAPEREVEDYARHTG